MTNKIFQEDLVSECCGRDYAVRLRLQDICSECGNDCELVTKDKYLQEQKELQEENMWQEDQEEKYSDSLEISEILYDEDSHNYTD